MPLDAANATAVDESDRLRTALTSINVRSLPRSKEAGGGLGGGRGDVVVDEPFQAGGVDL